MRTTSIFITFVKWFHKDKAARVTTASQVASALRQLRLATPLLILGRSSRHKVITNCPGEILLAKR